MVSYQELQYHFQSVSSWRCFQLSTNSSLPQERAHLVRTGLLCWRSGRAASSEHSAQECDTAVVDMMLALHNCVAVEDLNTAVTIIRFMDPSYSCKQSHNVVANL